MKTRAAIYARKSHAQERVAAEAKSVTRQLENARTFAEGKGWTVIQSFTDDAISGTEFEKRPGLQQVLAAAERKEFDVLIVAEQKTLGREQFEVGYLLKRLSKLGVTLWGYLEDKQLTPRGGTEKLISSIQAFSDEDVAVKTSIRMREAHERLAKAGHVTGGTVYGYRNVDVYVGEDSSGRPLRSHVDRKAEPAEAKVVVRVYREFVAGAGLRTIARGLDADHVPPPRTSGGGRPLGRWSPSTVRVILLRPLYGGVVTWGRQKKRDEWLQVKPTNQPADAVLRVPRPDLRIVPEELIRHARARLVESEGRTVRLAGGRLCGRPRKDGTTNLLANLATCAVCGGSVVRDRDAYICLRRRRHGSHLCSNTTKVPVADVDRAVLEEVERHVLVPARVEEFLLAASATVDDDRSDALERERHDVEVRISRLTAAIETGGEIGPLVERLRALEARKQAIAADLERSAPVPRPEPKAVKSRLAEWRRLLRGSPTQARAVLARVLDGKVTFRPLPGGIVELEGATRFSSLFVGFVVTQDAETAPPHVRVPDRRGHEAGDAERAALETAYEDVLRAAEKRVKPRGG